MRVLTFILILAVIVLISNASPPKKRAARTGVGLKRPFKSTAARQNAAASRAFAGPKTLRKSVKSKQFNKATRGNNRRSLQQGISSVSSNNGKIRRASAVRSRVAGTPSMERPVNNKNNNGFSSRNGKGPANRLPFAKIPDDIPLDDEQYLDELPDNDAAFDMPKYDKSIGNNRSGQKTSSDRTFGELNDELSDDDLTLDDLSDISTKSNETIDEMLQNLNLDDDEQNGGKANVEGINGDVGDAKSPELPAENADLNLPKDEKNGSALSDAELDELLKDIVVEPNSSEGAQIDEPIDVDKPTVETENDKPPLEPNFDNNDEEVGLHFDEPPANEGSEKVENSSGESSGNSVSDAATDKAADGKDYDYEDLDDEELPEDDYKEEDKV